MRYFQEKLKRRNVSQAIKHYEDCELLFMSVGKCFTIEALLAFFEMENTNGEIVKNGPPPHVSDVRDLSVLDKFIDEFFLLPHILPTPVPENEGELPSPDDKDFVRNYSLCLLKYYLILLDYKDAVKEGNGERLATLHKVLLPYFKSFKQKFHKYSIEMLISVLQNEIFLSNEEAFQCKWASTANWKGGSRENIEIDLLQENLNKGIIESIKMMGVDKTVSDIEWSSRSFGGERQIVENFDQQMNSVPPSSSQSHSSSITDEGKIMTDLRKLRPFNHVPNRKHDSFPDIVANRLTRVDQVDLGKWLGEHKKNLMKKN